MSLATAPAANKEMIEYWNSEAGETWAELGPLLDRQIEGIGRRAMDALGVRAGERVIDVGCGAGQTSVELAARVGPTGAVLGVDISAPMLAVARKRAAQSPQIRLVQGDAQIFDFEPGWGDAAFSRFGVMFFADPPAAFANIRRGLRSGARLAFACWREPFLNPFMGLPFAAAAPLLPEPPAPFDPTAPGPFAFADEARVRGILADAGFADVKMTPNDEKIGGGTLEETLRLALSIGPLGRAVRDRPELRERVRDAVRAALEKEEKDGRIFLGSASWIVTARNP
ncbi:MAG TPA: methyltransferase domain-containing protein [Caulobacteraceae bacterium]|nr:methyltransferase domain-containing protein [Caulobacteraceae bacterium]